MREKIIAVLVALYCAGALCADVTAVGRSRNDYPLIVPQVQKLVPANGNFALPVKLTVSGPEELYMAPLVKVYAQTVPGGAVERSADGAQCRFELTTHGVPKSPEGYTLAVTEAGIFVRARNVRGLYYGMQTLNMLLRHRDKAERLKCCRITDWPDLEMRGLYLQLRSVSPAKIDRICHVIDVLGVLKYNTLLVVWEDNFPYTDSPFTGRRETFSRADIEKLLAAAKRNHMEVIPVFQLVSHTGWLDSHPDWPKLREAGADAYCLSNPGIQPIIEKCIRETVDLVKPRYLHIGLDEIAQCGFPACPKCRNANPIKLMLDHLLPIKRFLVRQGITPIIYQDQFFGFGETRILGDISFSNFAEKFGKDVIVNSWEYGSFPQTTVGRKIRRRGFEKLLYMSFAQDVGNSWRLPKLAKKLNALGNILAFWSLTPPTLDDANNTHDRIYPSAIAQANYSWNAHDVAFSRLPIDSALLLRELVDGPPEWTFRGEASPIPMGGAFNRALVGDPVFPAFDANTVEAIRSAAAADPAKFRIEIQDGAILSTVLSGCRYDGFANEPVTIPVNTTATGASFLMTGAAFNTFVLETSLYRIKWFPIGLLKIVYADGGVAEIPLIFRSNINDWNTFFGGNCCRPVLRGNDRNGALFTLYAIDWRNPRPEAEIREIVFSPGGQHFSPGTVETIKKRGIQLPKHEPMVSPVLLACSLSDAGRAPTGATGETHVVSAPKRAKVKRTPLVSFADGIPAGTTSAAGGIFGFRYRVIPDARRGKVLEFHFDKVAQFLARAVVDIPIREPRDFESVIFDIKVSDNRAVYRPDFFVMKKNASKVFAAGGFYADVDSRWHTVCIPRQRFSASKDFSPTMAEVVRVGFFMHQWDRPVSILVSDIDYGDGVLPCRINITDPAK